MNHKRLALQLAGLLLATALTTPLWAAAPATVTGQVLEVKDVEVYTYLRLKTAQGETWAAVSRAPVKIGSTVTLENVNVMENFESKSLKKTFPSILFANLAGSGATAASTTDPHASMRKAEPIGPIKVAKAKGANAYTVAELFAQAGKLKDKPVRLAGKVVKVNNGIMGKNWIHLQDSTGAADARDMLVTSAATAKVGDVVTAAGTLRNDRDFGAGYTYKVLLEDASLTP